MSSKSQKRPVDRGGSEALHAATLLKELASADDAALPAWHKKRGPADGPATVERLGRARDLLDAVGGALATTDEVPWLRIEAAWRVIVEGATEARVAAELAKAEAAEQPPPRAKPKPRPAKAASAKAREPARLATAAAPHPPAVAEPAEVVRAAGATGGGLASPAGLAVARAQAGDVSSPWARASAATGHDHAPLLVPERPSSGGLAGGGVHRPSAPSVDASLARPSQAGAPPPPAPRPSAPGPVAPSASAPIASGSFETEEVDLASLSFEALPFRGSAEPPQPGVAAADLPPLSDRDLDGTSVTGKPVDVDETLPFVGARSLRKELAAGAAARGRPRVEPPAPAPHTEMTVEHFASLCAASEAEPARAADIERRFGIASAEARIALDEAWKARFRADPNLYRAFCARFHEYRSWLVSQRTRG